MASRRQIAPKAGDAPTEEPGSADRPSARQAAVALLARRDFCASELTAKLKRQGHDGAEVARVVAELTASRIIDDARFAERFLAYHAARGQGPMRIRRDLRTLGLADALIDHAFEAGPDFKALAAATRQRKFGRAAPASFKEKARQARFLQYRGFSADHIRSVVGSVAGGEFDPDS